MQNSYYIAVIVAVIATTQETIALSTNNRTIEPCFEVKETVSVDVNWIMSANTWFYVLQSRTNLFRLCEALRGNQAKSMREDQIYSDLCPILVFNGTDSTLHGFGNRQVKYLATPHEGRTDAVDLVVTDLDGHTTSGVCYKTFTDNSTFFVNTCCFKDGRMIWEALSPLKKLADKTKERIFDHAESIGFNRAEFTAVRYDTCFQKA